MKTTHYMWNMQTLYMRTGAGLCAFKDTGVISPFVSYGRCVPRT
ncbi:MAG: hypothetical protein AAB460_02070 [Patescibacteria group bacterium]